jgi:hypothetical protein
MRPLIAVLTLLSIMALAFWAYRENYATQATLREMKALQQEIGDLREALTLQKAEWAYLNRPERLRDLVALNFERVPLLPLDPTQFRKVADVAMPLPPLPFPPDLNAVDVSGTLPENEEPL